MQHERYRGHLPYVLSKEKSFFQASKYSLENGAAAHSGEYRWHFCVAFTTEMVVGSDLSNSVTFQHTESCFQLVCF